MVVWLSVCVSCLGMRLLGGAGSGAGSGAGGSSSGFIAGRFTLPLYSSTHFFPHPACDHPQG
jgi:hypothetical protein